MVERSPVNDYAHFCLGRAFQLTGHRTEARRHLKLAQRGHRIVEVQPPNELPVWMVRCSRDCVGRRSHPGSQLLASRSVFIPPLACTRELVLQL